MGNLKKNKIMGEEYGNKEMVGGEKKIRERRDREERK